MVLALQACRRPALPSRSDRNFRTDLRSPTVALEVDLVPSDDQVLSTQTSRRVCVRCSRLRATHATSVARSIADLTLSDLRSKRNIVLRIRHFLTSKQSHSLLELTWRDRLLKRDLARTRQDFDPHLGLALVLTFRDLDFDLVLIDPFEVR